ncbi:hypothetical protein CARUB_v10025507mg [Capsella rubella]|uniref:Uncharacterized protein n=1 Tax=Capsella rubella TaxID=81985 RepID=R0HUZ4_9BRAS|nr:uncharacterized protein LOC17890067 [Capsella rubella]EOA29235.1 hypothetical protein CARUB_v10025507mg [Capsella rubella]
MNYISTKNVFDVSPFLLLEASADSEAVPDDAVQWPPKDYNIDGDQSSNRSEASSCETSCVTWASQRPCRLEFDLFLLQDTVKEEIDSGDEEVDDDDDDDGDEGEVNSYIRGQRENPALVSGSVAVVISEMDQSRMFWEACLAS